MYKYKIFLSEVVKIEMPRKTFVTALLMTSYLFHKDDIKNAVDVFYPK